MEIVFNIYADTLLHQSDQNLRMENSFSVLY